jgi:hypothetical protein
MGTQKARYEEIFEGQEQGLLGHDMKRKKRPTGTYEKHILEDFSRNALFLSRLARWCRSYAADAHWGLL